MSLHGEPGVGAGSPTNRELRAVVNMSPPMVDTHARPAATPRGTRPCLSCEWPGEERSASWKRGPDALGVGAEEAPRRTRPSHAVSQTQQLQPTMEKQTTQLAKGSNRYFSGEAEQMASRAVERCSHTESSGTCKQRARWGTAWHPLGGLVSKRTKPENRQYWWGYGETGSLACPTSRVAGGCAVPGPLWEPVERLQGLQGPQGW